MLWRIILEKVKSNIRFLWLQLKFYMMAFLFPSQQQSLTRHKLFV